MLDPNNTFFTADPHFGHEALYHPVTGMRRVKIKDGRPVGFKNADEADAYMIEKYNEVVPPGGVTIIIGDFTYGRANKRGLSYWKDIVSQLNGTIMFILGNHDDAVPVHDLLSIPKLVWVGVRRRITVLDPEGNVQRKNNPSYQEILVDHYPLEVWDKKKFGAWHLHSGSWHAHGHMHASLPSRGLRIDVGVDTNKFKPYTYAQVKERMAKLGVKMRKEVRQ
jgi:calcineurin-like phosphoesterase family protein